MPLTSLTGWTQCESCLVILALSCRYGWACFLFYIAAFLYYLYVRIRYTIHGLGPGYEVYGIALLIVECLGASTIVLFGIQMLWDPLHEKYPEDPNRPGVPQVQPLLWRVSCDAALA